MFSSQHITILQMIILVSCSLVGYVNPHTHSLFCNFASGQCPDSDIQFYFYNKYRQDKPPVLLDPLNMTMDLFEPLLPIVILIHGFAGTFHLPPNAELRSTLLQNQDVHVISVDYSYYSRFPCYHPWAVQNIRSVGKCLAQLIDNMAKSGICSTQDIHLIGFSIGSHLAGFAGQYAKNRLGRITGLDPTRFFFTGKAPTERLDPSDAEFVDVIHTDPNFYGFKRAIGHADFYPNYYDFIQPGCIFITIYGLENCNHHRAPVYYAESIRSPNAFWSYNCGDVSSNESCHKYSHIPSVAMGYFVPKNASGSYFLTTNSEAPYGRVQFQDVQFSLN